jgi:hypothetical protein
MPDTLFHLMLILPEQAIEALKLSKAEQCSFGYKGALDTKRLSVLHFTLRRVKPSDESIKKLISCVIFKNRAFDILKITSVFAVPFKMDMRSTTWAPFDISNNRFVRLDGTRGTMTCRDFSSYALSSIGGDLATDLYSCQGSFR